MFKPALLLQASNQPVNHPEHCLRSPFAFHPPAFRRCVSALFLAMAVAGCGRSAAVPPPVVDLLPGETHLDDVGYYSVTYQYLDGKQGSMPMGWTGHFDDATGISAIPFGTQDGKSTFLLHPIWRNGTGDTDQTFRLKLPAAGPILLRFSIAMKEGMTGPAKSDGATFRVFLNDKPLLDQNKTDESWSPYQMDLSPYAGQVVTLRFETDPGPAHNPSFDFALWGDREIVAGAPGSHSAPARLWPVPPLSPRTATWEGDSPTVPASWKGAPAISASVGPSTGGFLAGWSMKIAPPAGGAGITTPLGTGAYLDLVAADGRIVSSNAPEVTAEVKDTPNSGGFPVRRQITYHVGDRAIHVQVVFDRPKGSSVRVEVQSADPYIAKVVFGSAGPFPIRRSLSVPYLGTLVYLPGQQLFSNVIVDYTRSGASSLDPNSASYGPLTDGSRNPVRETAYFAISPDLISVLPTPPNPPSPYREALGKHVILDVWGGNFTDDAAWLRELASYHLTHFMTIVHDWQNGGYDNKLPNVLPANPRLGDDEGMKEWVKTAVDLHELIGLHENYVDFYPNAAAYDEADVAHDSNHHLIPAWKNIIQSYAVAPTAILKYARMFTPEVHQRFGTNGSYLDVHSAVPPWFHVDFRKEVPGAGKFETVFNAHRDLWKLFRETHGGPVLGEGSNHWYWSGLLDGVEAQFGVGWPGNEGETAPLFVDFDLAKIHPLQFNHGMGYWERWAAGGFGAGSSMKRTDQYRMQEIAYGHAGFVASSFVRQLPFVWQEHNLVWPVTSHYASMNASAIEYEVDGKLLDTAAAIAAGSSFDRVRIAYQGKAGEDLGIRANSRPDNWSVKIGDETLDLPQYGWVARLPNKGIAYTALRDGVVVDYSETPTTLFANARSDVPGFPRKIQATPTLGDFVQDGPRQFHLTFHWTLREAIPKGYVPFVHVTQFGDGGEDIVFQTGSGIDASPDTWKVGETTTGQPVNVKLADDLKDGVYTFVTGIYSPAGGDRLDLVGKDDGHHRYILGRLAVADSGNKLSFVPEPAPVGPVMDELAAHLDHTNPDHKFVNFGKVATNGSVLIEREEAGSWVLTPFPRTHPFDVVLHTTEIDRALKSAKVQALDIDGKILGPVETKTVAGPAIAITVNTTPGAVRYRISNR